MLQTQVEEVKGALGDIKTQITGIDAKLDGFSATYVTRGEFEAFKANRWLERILVAIVTGSITALLFYFFRVHP